MPADTSYQRSISLIDRTLAKPKPFKYSLCGKLPAHCYTVWTPRLDLSLYFPLRNETRQQKAARLHNRTKVLSEMYRSSGAARLWTLWEIYREGLWMEFTPTNAEGKAIEYSFEQYVLDYHTDDENMDEGDDTRFIPQYQTDIVQIIDLIFQRVTSERVLLPDSTRITPQMLLEIGGMRRLRRAKQLISNTKNPKLIHEYIIGIAMKKPYEWFSTLEQSSRKTSLPVRLPYVYLSQQRDGKWSANIRDMNDDQKRVFESMVQNFTEGFRQE